MMGGKTEREYYFHKFSFFFFLALTSINHCTTVHKAVFIKRLQKKHLTPSSKKFILFFVLVLSVIFTCFNSITYFII